MNRSTYTQNGPLFSIVVPTRNRCHLLRQALRSAVAQDFADYEIVVSNNHSSDDTEKVADEFASAQLRVVRTSKPLSMPDHWEFAVEHARGEYVMFLCDDDALHAAALAEAANVVAKHDSSLIMLGGTVYWGPNSIDIACRNSIMVPYFSGRTEVVDSRHTLREMSRFIPQPLFLPRMLNSLCRRDLLMKVREEAGRIFLLSPDYSFALMMLAATPTWAYIHKPLWVCGCFAESTGMSTVQNRDGAVQTFIKEMNGQPMLRNTPMSAVLLNNGLADTYLECKKLLPRLLEDFEIDWAQYFAACWIDILTLEGYGGNVRNDIAEFESALDAQPEEIQKKVRRSISTPMMRARRMFGYRIPQSRWLIRLGSRFTHNSRFYWGDRHGFGNIFEASQMLQRLCATVQGSNKSYVEMQTTIR